MGRSRALATAVVAVGAIVAETALMRRRGYRVGVRTIVRCRDGHLFTTVWIPGASVKAVRLGTVRLQYCPVGRHFTAVKPVRDAELTDNDRAVAALRRDMPIP